MLSTQFKDFAAKRKINLIKRRDRKKNDTDRNRKTTLNWSEKFGINEKIRVAIIILKTIF